MSPKTLTTDLPLELPDRRVIACNIIEGTSAIASGSLAYAAMLSPTGGAPDKLPVVARSRSGRWVYVWIKLANLDHFRAKTIPPQNPLYDDYRFPDSPNAKIYADELQGQSDRFRTPPSNQVPKPERG